MRKFNFYYNNVIFTFLAMWTFFFFDVMSSFSLFFIWCSFYLVIIVLQSFILMRRNTLFGIFYGVLAVFLAVLIIRSPGISGYRTIVAEGYSGCPVLCDGDIAVVRTKNISYHRGAMVLIQMTDSIAPYSKRIHGTPGDVILICDNNVYTNGYNFNYHEGQWLVHELLNNTCSFRNEQFTLERDEYFVLGDSAEMSVDSRHFGSINASQILGNVIFKGSPETGLQSISVDASFSIPPQDSD